MRHGHVQMTRPFFGPMRAWRAERMVQVAECKHCGYKPPESMTHHLKVKHGIRVRSKDELLQHAIITEVKP